MTAIMSSTPDPTAYRIRRADWGRDRGALRRIRLDVFVHEQGVPESLEWDDQDAAAVHLVALDGAGRPIGTARLLPTGQIGRMAVLPERRGQGVGSALLREILQIAADDGYPDIFLNAQTSALPFYLRAGFQPVGHAFDEAGIPHRRMTLVGASHAIAE
jgi:predicted GNAT family N-acyltransferase